MDRKSIIDQYNDALDLEKDMKRIDKNESTPPDPSEVVRTAKTALSAWDSDTHVTDEMLVKLGNAMIALRAALEKEE